MGMGGRWFGPEQALLGILRVHWDPNMPAGGTTYTQIDFFSRDLFVSDGFRPPETSLGLLPGMSLYRTPHTATLIVGFMEIFDLGPKLGPHLHRFDFSCARASGGDQKVTLVPMWVMYKYDIPGARGASGAVIFSSNFYSPPLYINTASRSLQKRRNQPRSRI